MRHEETDPTSSQYLLFPQERPKRKKVLSDKEKNTCQLYFLEVEQFSGIKDIEELSPTARMPTTFIWPFGNRGCQLWKMMKVVDWAIPGVHLADWEHPSLKRMSQNCTGGSRCPLFFLLDTQIGIPYVGQRDPQGRSGYHWTNNGKPKVDRQHRLNEVFLDLDWLESKFCVIDIVFAGAAGWLLMADVAVKSFKFRVIAVFAPNRAAKRSSFFRLLMEF